MNMQHVDQILYKNYTLEQISDIFVYQIFKKLLDIFWKFHHLLMKRKSFKYFIKNN